MLCVPDQELERKLRGRESEGVRTKAFVVETFCTFIRMAQLCFIINA